MSSRQPLDPNTPIDPFTTPSLTGLDAQTGIFLDADQTNSSVLIKTADTPAMYIDKFQNMGINTTAPSAQLDVNSASSSHIQLTYNGSATSKAQIGVSSDGKLLLTPGGSEVSIDSTSSLNIKGHNGSNAGLMLGNSLVLATADQLNFSVVTPGTASNNKALVTNSSGSIAGINSLSASQLTGTIQTADQPNITSVNTLDVANHNGITGLALGGTTVTATAQELNYVDTTPGMATASKALVLNGDRDILNIHHLSADQLTGTLQTAAQPNVTSLGTLTNLNFDGPLTGLTDLSVNTTETGRTLVLNHETGNTLRMFYDAETSANNYADLLIDSMGNMMVTTTGGNVDITTHDGVSQGLKLGSVLVTASADQLNYLQGTTPGAVTSGKAVVMDANRNIGNINSLVSTNLAGTIQTPSQPNIASVSALNITTHDGDSVGLKLGNVLVTASAAELNYVDTTKGVAEASKALVVDASRDISNINSLAAEELTGLLMTPAQPNVTSVGTLDSLAVGGDVTVGSTVISESDIAKIDGITNGTAAAGKAVVLDASSNIAGIAALSATSLTGTIQTAAQPKITSVTTLDITGHDGSLAGLALDGELVTASATEINYVDTTQGIAQASKALVVDANRDIVDIHALTALELTGTLKTAAQPNVTSVGRLTSLSVAGTVTMGTTTLDEAEVAVLDGVVPGTVSPSKALVADANKDISTIRTLGAVTVNAGSVVATDVTGTLQTAAQPNISSVTTLDITSHDGSTSGLKLGGTLLTATAEQINSIFGAGGEGTFNNLSVIDTLTVANADGETMGLVLGETLVTASGEELNYIDGSTPGTVVAGKAVVVDDNKDISSFRNLTAVNVTGELQTASQPKITSVGTLTSLAVAGTVTVGSTTLSQEEVAVLDAVAPGTAAASKALVLDSDKNISGISSISASDLTIASGFVYGTTDLTETEMAVLDQVVPGAASASKALVVDASKNISGIAALSSSTLQATAGTLTMGETIISESEIGVLDAVVPGTVAASKAVVVDANKDASSFRNLTSVNLISSGGSLTMGATVIDEAEIGVLDASKAVVLDASKNVSAINELSATALVSTAGSLTMGATAISETEIGVLNEVTPGTVSPFKAVVVDGNKDASSFRHLTSVSLTSTSGSLTMGGTTLDETELGYVNAVTPGAAAAFKAVVLDDSKDISGIHSLSADAVTTTTLTVGETVFDESAVVVLDGVTHGEAAADKALVLDENKDISGIRDLSATTLESTAGALTMGATTISESEVAVLDSVVPGVVTASKAVVVDSNKDIASFRNLTAVNLTGTLQTAAQPKVTSVGTLESVHVAGDITADSDIVMGETTISEEDIAKIDSVVNGTAAADKALVVSSTRDIANINSLSAAQITGTLQTAAQPNVTSVSVLNVTNHDGTTAGLALGGTLLTTTAAQINDLFDGVSDLTVVNEVVTTDLNLSGHDGATHGLKLSGSLVTANATEMNYLDGATPGHAVPSKALIFDENKDIDGIHDLKAANVTGTIQTAAQPKITSVTTLDITGHDGEEAGLALGGVLLTATADQINSIFGDGGEGTFNNLRVNDTLTLANADGSSMGLVLGSTLVTASGAELNYLDGSTPGAATAGNAIVLDSSRDIANIHALTADELTGTLKTAAQPNVTSVGTLSSLSVAGTVTVGATTLQESEVAVLDAVVPGAVAASKAVVVDANKDISSFRNLTAVSVTADKLTGTIQTAAQPNITSVGELTALDVAGDVNVGGSLTVGGTIISEAEIAVIDAATPGTAEANKALVTNASNSIAGINSLSATSLTGTLQTAAQPQITSVGELTSLDVAGDVNVGGNLNVGGTFISEAEIVALDAATPGTASATKAMITDSNNSIAGINALSATTLTGTLQTAAQPKIKSVSTLDITSHDGATTGLELGGALVTASASELNYVDTTIGAAEATKALVLDASKNITGINHMTMTTLTSGSGSFVDATDSMSTSTGAIVTAGGVGIGKSIAIGTSAFVGTDLSVGGQTSMSGSVSLSSTDDSTNASSGALTVAGGVGVAKSLFVGSNASVVGNLAVTGTTSTAGAFSVTNDTQSTTTSNGAIVTAGGMGVAKNLNVGGAASVAGAFAVSGATALTGGLSQLDTTDSTSTSTGAIVTSGGVGIAKSLTVGENAAVSGALSVSGSTSAAGAVVITNNTASTSATTGALKVAGGAGVAGALNVGGTASVTGNVTLEADAGVAGALSVGGDASVAGDVSMAGDVVIDGHLTSTNVVFTGDASARYEIKVDSTYMKSETGAGYQWYNNSTAELSGTKLMELDDSLTVNVPESITDSTDASSATTGALTVAGGVGIAKKLYVGSSASVAGAFNVSGATSLTGTVAIASPTEATDAATGSLTTAGGAGIAKSLHVGADVGVVGDLQVGGSTELTGSVAVASVAESTDAASGSIVTAGGVGVAKSLHVGADAGIVGDLAVQGDSAFTGSVAVANVTDASSITTGAFTTAGGAGIAKSLHVGGDIVVAGTVTATGDLNQEGVISSNDTTDSTSVATGAIVTARGVGIAKSVHVGGSVAIESGVASVNSSTGALVVDGGVGVSSDVNVGGDVHIVGDEYLVGDFNLSGVLHTSNVTYTPDASSPFAIDPITLVASTNSPLSINKDAGIGYFYNNQEFVVVPTLVTTGSVLYRGTLDAMSTWSAIGLTGEAHATFTTDYTEYIMKVSQVVIRPWSNQIWVAGAFVHSSGLESVAVVFSGSIDGLDSLYIVGSASASSGDFCSTSIAVATDDASVAVVRKMAVGSASLFHMDVTAETPAFTQVTTGDFKSVSWLGGLGKFAATRNGPSSIYTSANTDADVWVDGTTPTGVGANTIYFNSTLNLAVAVGDNFIWYSTNGYVWTKCTYPELPAGDKFTAVVNSPISDLMAIYSNVNNSVKQVYYSTAIVNWSTQTMTTNFGCNVPLTSNVALDASYHAYSVGFNGTATAIQMIGPVTDASRVYRTVVASGYVKNDSASGYKWFHNSTATSNGNQLMQLNSSSLTVTPTVSVSNTTDSTSTSSGSIVTTGGVGIAKSLVVGTNASVSGSLAVSGATSQAGILSVTNVTQSDSVESGALRVAGGVGISKNLNVGAAASIEGTLAVTGATEFSNDLTVRGATESMTSATGALTVAGGVGIAKSLNVGIDANVHGDLTVDGSSTFVGSQSIVSSEDAMSVATGSIVTAGGVGIAKKLYVGSNTSIAGALSVSGATNLAGLSSVSDSTDATSATAAALTVAGGVGISKKLVVGSNATIAGALAVTGVSTLASDVVIASTTDSMDAASGSVTTAGGLGVAKKLNVGGHTGLASTLAVAGTASITDVTDASSSTTGALTVAGGVGIAKKLYVGSGMYGTVMTAEQPYISSVSALGVTSHDGVQGLKLGGALVTSSADELNYVDGSLPGQAIPGKGLVFDSNKDISGINQVSASKLVGTIQTSSQPLITSVSTLNVASHDGATTGLSLGGTLLTVPASTINDFFAGSGNTTVVNQTITNNLTLTGHNGADVGLILGSTLVTATGTELNYVDTTPGTAQASKALVLDANTSVAGIDSLTATSITGTLQTASQPNLTSVTTLNITGHNGSSAGLALNGSIVTSTASELNYVDTTPGTAEASKALVLNSSLDIAGIHSLSAELLTGTLQTPAQPKITSVGTLTSLALSGDLTMGSTVISETDIAKIDGITNGSAAASKALVLDSNKQVSGINKISTTSMLIGAPSHSELPLEVGATSYQFTGAYAYANDSNAHGMVNAGDGVIANYSMRADGRILCTGEIQITSDRRMKENVTDLSLQLAKEFVMTSRPVKFNWKNGDENTDYGFIAQEVYKAGFTDLVTITPHADMEEIIDEDGFVSPAGGKFVFAPGKIVPLLVLSQRETYTKLEEKDQQTQSLQSTVQDLEARLARLEALLYYKGH